MKDGALAGHRTPAVRVGAGRLRSLLANIECGTMAIQPFSARLHPSLACPLRWLRPLGSPNALPAVEFSAAILAAVVPEGRSRRAPKCTTSQPCALPFPSESSPFLGGVSRRITGRCSTIVTDVPNSARREVPCGSSRFIAGDVTAISSRACNDAALLHRLGPPPGVGKSKLAHDIISLVAGWQLVPTKPGQGVSGQRTGIVQCPPCSCPHRQRAIVTC